MPAAVNREIVEVAYEYPVSYVARGARKPQHGTMRGRMPVEIAVVSADAAPVVMEAHLLGNMDFTANGRKTVRTVLRSYGGHLVTDASHAIAPAVSRVADLAVGRSPHAPESPWGRAAYPFFRFDSSSRHVRPEDVRILATSGQAAEEARVRDVASRICLAGDALLVPHSEPVWSVHTPIRSLGEPRTTYVYLSRSDDRHRSGHQLFNVDRLDAALAYARFMGTEHPYPCAGPIDIVGSLDRLDGYVPQREDAHEASVATFARLRGANLGQDFARLPLAALAAWTDFRSTVESPGFAPEHHEEAWSSLRRLFDALPPHPGPSRTGRFQDDAAFILRDALAGPLHRWETIDAELRHQTSPDAAALASL